ncbi:flavonoid O-methyltransferase-like protein Os11g0303600 [Sorghum bicolor]|nr:flavonoid O-methyltransferase-like protein Os11g0303600 [Sorghum bicolor]|eukprot:XP_002489328.2 flavonoid O-methyltransferase-like protein Os11g0303600 [Sorghum bicolor]
MATKSQSYIVPTDAELLQAQADLWRHSLYYLKSMALKCAVELGIPTAIHRLGGAASLPDLITSLSLPQAKLPFLHRLMRLLSSSGVFSVSEESTEVMAIVYGLTPLSYLLVEGIAADGHINHAPFLLTATSTRYIDLAMGLADWFKKDAKTAPFDHVHGASLFEESMELLDPEYHKMSMQALVVHDNFAVDIALREFSGIFQGIKSLTDCCYHGDGTTAKAIAMAFPHMKITVLDIPQEIQKIPADGVVNYVGGDMFKFIPPAQVVMLKMVLHHWSDEDCVKILSNCRKAVPSREEGGKVLIGDIVIDPASGPMYETQLLMDVGMMLMKGGRQRDENEWRDIFMKAGFSDYKLVSKFGARGVLEAYP